MTRPGQKMIAAIFLLFACLNSVISASFSEHSSHFLIFQQANIPPRSADLSEYVDAITHIMENCPSFKSSHTRSIRNLMLEFGIDLKPAIESWLESHYGERNNFDYSGVSKKITSMLLEELEVPLIQSHEKYLSGYFSDSKNFKRLDEMHRMILERSADLMLIQTAFSFISDSTTMAYMPDSCLSAISSGLYNVIVPSTKKTYPVYVWLPSSGSEGKLFEQISPMTVHTINSPHVAGLRAMFSCALLSDYIIPYACGKMPYEEFASIKGYMKGILSKNNTAFTPYFSLLARTLFLTYNSSKEHSERTTQIREALKHLGFMQTYTSKVLAISNKVANMMEEKWDDKEIYSILRIARQWGLDFDQLVTNTSVFSEVSRAILQGAVPYALREHAPVTAEDVMFVTYYHDEAPGQCSVIKKSRKVKLPSASSKRLSRTNWLYGPNGSDGIMHQAKSLPAAQKPVYRLDFSPAPGDNVFPGVPAFNPTTPFIPQPFQTLVELSFPGVPIFNPSAAFIPQPPVQTPVRPAFPEIPPFQPPFHFVPVGPNVFSPDVSVENFHSNQWPSLDLNAFAFGPSHLQVPVPEVITTQKPVSVNVPTRRQTLRTEMPQVEMAVEVISAALADSTPFGILAEDIPYANVVKEPSGMVVDIEDVPYATLVQPASEMDIEGGEYEVEDEQIEAEEKLIAALLLRIRGRND